MRARITLLRRWPFRLGRDRPRLGKRAFSFTQGSAAAQWNSHTRTRPQLPFLLIPSAKHQQKQPQQFRYLTTQRKQYLRHEAVAFVKITVSFWAVVGCFVLGQWVIQQEFMEGAYPTPPEWTFLSRMRLRGAMTMRDQGDGSSGGATGGSGLDEPSTADVRVVPYDSIIQVLLDLVTRLEDPRIDGGDGLVGVLDTLETDQTDAHGLSLIADSQAMDIRAKSEPWRRGYFQTLLAAAEAAEHVEGWVVDRTRNNVYPPDVVLGPSNPHPRPLAPGETGAPREENCETCFPVPAELYLKLLHTRGFTTRQQITAALAFANYLEFKNDTEAAEFIYSRAILAAAAGPPAVSDDDLNHNILSPSPADPPDAAGWVKDWADRHADDGTISQNLMETLTAYATFRARTGDVSGALPILVGLLKAHRALPPAKSPSSSLSLQLAAAVPTTGVFSKIKAFVRPSAYPPAPDDGFGPPLPGPQARCEEAALHLHIGEILYASAPKSGSSSWLASSHQQQPREEGIAWTREAVDMAEEQLHAVTQREKEQKQLRVIPVLNPLLDDGIEGKTACRECLVAGLNNWKAMVAQLVRDEEQKAAAAAAKYSASADGSAASSSSWSFWPFWAFWGESPAASPAALNSGAGSKLGRWAAEQKVVQDRRRRAAELLDDSAPAEQGIMALFTT